ncbi:MAG: ABC transporter substrate-binding protein, partial [Planctomycetota bacterium]
SLDPASIDDVESGQVCDLIYEGLVTFADGPDALAKDVQPALATSWEISDDGTQYTFHLRKDAYFHDATRGTINAQAVKMSLDRLVGLDKTYAGNGTFPYRSDYEIITAVDIVDPMTVKLTLAEPDIVILRKLAMAPAYIIGPQTLIGLQNGEPFKPIGTGPFMLHYVQEWVKGESLTLTRFPAYWGAKPAPYQLIFKVIKDNTQRVNALMSGGVQLIADVPPDNVQALYRDPKLQVFETQVPNVCYLAMNPNPIYTPAEGKQEPNPLSEKWVREAIAMAIDKTTLAMTQYRGMAIPARSILPPGVLGFPMSAEDDTVRTPVRLDEARRALEAHGYSKDKPLKIKLWGMSESRPYITAPTDVLSEIRRQLADAWIDVELITLDWGRYKVDMQTGAYYFCVIGWVTDNGDPDNFLGVLFGLGVDGEPGALNVAKWVNPEFDLLLRDARRAKIVKPAGATTEQIGNLIIAERQRLYEKAAELMTRDRICIPLVHTSTVWAGSKDVQGFSLHPIGRLEITQAKIAKPEPAAPATNENRAAPVNSNEAGGAISNK